MSKTKTTKKAAAPKATKSAEAPKSAPAKKGEATKPVVSKAKAKAGAEGEAKTKKLSAIDAAAKVLADSRTAMNCKELIEAIATKGLWTSPGGKTPHATLYSAILREIQVKGKDARFVKTERGHFTIAGNGAATTKAAKTEIADGSPGPKSLSKLFKI